MNVFDVLAGTGIVIDPKKAKIHLAVHNGEEDPLDVFFAGRFKAWQESQKRLNFRHEKIVSLIKMPQRDRWLFAGVYSTHGYVQDAKTSRFIYKTRLETASAQLIGRLVVRFKRSGKQSYLLGENFGHSLSIDELRPTALTAEDCSVPRQPAVTPGLDAWAAASLKALVGHVYRCRGNPLVTITYEELASLMGRRTSDGKRPWARGLGRVLGRMGRALAGIGDEWQQSLPHIQGIVVQKTGPGRGLPDDGIKEFWPHFPKLSRTEKQAKVRIELARVEQFGSRWNDVLEQLHLSPVASAASTSVHGVQYYGSGGESPQHKALKEYVRANPSIVGASGASEAIAEYGLPSLDEIDVLFRSDDECVAVEVKSSISDRVSGDFERGIYQAIKYLALLRAMSLDRKRGICPNIRSVLVLQGSLPTDLGDLAKLLSVEVIQNVMPTEQHLRIATAKSRINHPNFQRVRSTRSNSRT